MKDSDSSIREPNVNWIERWQAQDIGWHHVEFNPHLLNHWHSLCLPQGSLVLAPLCGKSRDLVWLAEEGYRVRGIELSPLAVEGFFVEQKLKPTRISLQGFERWTSGPYDIYCGDIFDLPLMDNRDIDAVYDRASLVALNPDQRRHYARLLIKLLPEKTSMLLVTMDYPQAEMQGPPYSVQMMEVQALFESRFAVTLLHSLDLLKETDRYGNHGVSRMMEQVYLLKQSS